ncbi:ribosomal large subunit pseudouridine synthase F [Escherichia coli]|uniref:Ribosomal large subunit pseudouridine synthase F n=1 Tax=Escherichia coli TaxID=562 RepID=A0A376TPL7_ECOLX|nr:ribosomal large subunit pseudouridine synthase F [Escherichia coli]
MSISLTTAKRVFPIGRLDKDSQGLIFLTNHGDLVNKILRAGNDHEKEYLVTVDKPITDEFIRGMGAGVPILGTVTKKVQSQKRSAVCLPHYPGAGAEPSDPAHVRAFRL